MRGHFTFTEFRQANFQRAKRWHPGFPFDPEWLISDWSNAMAGEAGEACNVVKKIRRHEVGLAGRPDDPSPDELKVMLGKEIADTVIYADLLAAKVGFLLPEIIVPKFNEVSERMGFPERLEL